MDHSPLFAEVSKTPARVNGKRLNRGTIPRRYVGDHSFPSKKEGRKEKMAKKWKDRDHTVSKEAKARRMEEIALKRGKKTNVGDPNKGASSKGR